MALGAHGRRVMEALERGQGFRRTGEEWIGGALRAPDALIEELKRRDLVREEVGALALTAAGIGYTARNRRPEGANRLLAEKPLPRDGVAKGAAPARTVTVNLRSATARTRPGG